MHVNIFLVPTPRELTQIAKGASFMWKHAHPNYLDRIEDIFTAAFAAGSSVQIAKSDFVDNRGVRRLDIYSNGWVKNESSFITFPALTNGRGIPVPEESWG